MRETVCYFKIVRIMNNPFTAKCIFSDLKLPSFQTRNLQVKKDYMYSTKLYCIVRSIFNCRQSTFCKSNRGTILFYIDSGNRKYGKVAFFVIDGF